MKKHKIKSLVKTARKAVRKNIKLEIYLDLKAIADKAVPESKKIEKVIKKDAKALAKIISRHLKIDENSLQTLENPILDVVVDKELSTNDLPKVDIQEEVNTTETPVKKSATKRDKKVVKA